MKALLSLAAASIAALVLSGCAASSRLAFPDEAEAWGHDLPVLGR